MVKNFWTIQLKFRKFCEKLKKKSQKKSEKKQSVVNSIWGIFFLLYAIKIKIVVAKKKVYNFFTQTETVIDFY